MHATPICSAPTGLPPFAPAARGRAGRVDAGMVHDIGNLLQVVTSAFNILSRELSPADTSKLAQAIASARGSLERASALVRQSMSAARDETTVSAPIDLARCLIALEPTLRATCGAAVTVELSAASGRALLTCDRAAFESVVLALTSNARDAMPQGGVLSIASGGNDHEVYVRIADTGCGMAPDVRLRALEPAFVCDGGETGLAVAARFVATAGGRIDIEAAADTGTALTLIFPKHLQGVVS